MTDDSLSFCSAAAPCPPVMNTPELNCSTNQVHVSWEQGDNAVEGVMVNAVSEMDAHNHSCEAYWGEQSCDLTDLHCGQRYTVRGTALAGGCDSVASRPFNLTTGACKHHTQTHTHACTHMQTQTHADTPIQKPCLLILTDTLTHSQ